MNNHYIPRLLLKYFAENGRVQSYDFATKTLQSKKISKTFSIPDLYDEELEKAFATRLEGPFGNLLQHKLLQGEQIRINREENFLIRKFRLVGVLRNDLTNESWEGMLARTGLYDHPEVRLKEMMERASPVLRKLNKRLCFSRDTFIPDLRKVMELDSMDQLVEKFEVIMNKLMDQSKERPEDGRFMDSFFEPLLEADDETLSLYRVGVFAEQSQMAVTAIWDCESTGQEFILPKMTGISQMDDVGSFYKTAVIKSRIQEIEENWMPEDLGWEMRRMFYGSMVFWENFNMYPLSPTRILVYFSPYFRAFFPIKGAPGSRVVYPPPLDRRQFDRHFYKPLHMELFEPCKSIDNREYLYKVKRLTEDELHQINALMLNMETEEFVIHDPEKLKETFYYYDKRARFAMNKKHNFSQLE